MGSQTPTETSPPAPLPEPARPGSAAEPLGRYERLRRWLLHSRRPLLIILLALLLGGGTVALIGKAANYDTLLDAVREADKRWLVLCFAGELLAYAGYILAYRDCARVDGGPVLEFWLATRVVIAGFGAFVVATSAGGLAVDYWALRKAGQSRHQAIARVLGLNTLEWLVLGVAAWTASLVLFIGLGPDVPLGLTLTWLVVVPLCIAGGWWVSSPGRRERLTRIAEGAGRLRTAFADAVAGVVLVRRVVGRPTRYPAGVLGFPCYWAGHMLCLYGGLRAFDARVGLPALILGFASGYAASALPLPAGGSGGIEGGMTFALTAVGVPLAPALLGVVAYRIFTFWLPMVPALAVLPTLRGLRHELEEHSGARSATAGAAAA
ncbi:MAG: putative heme transporter [Miltoncostaeaceae bacterium]|nr:putative heme transporter [Miltoncostaeaceae bacterium]